MVCVKGQSGNPGGRPKSRPFKDALDRAIKASAEGKEAAISLDDIALALLTKAKSGDVPAIKELAERYDGKVAQAIVGDDDEDPIRVETIRRIIVKPGHSDGGGVPPAAAAG